MKFILFALGLYLVAFGVLTITQFDCPGKSGHFSALVVSEPVEQSVERETLFPGETWQIGPVTVGAGRVVIDAAPAVSGIYLVDTVRGEKLCVFENGDRRGDGVQGGDGSGFAGAVARLREYPPKDQRASLSSWGQRIESGLSGAYAAEDEPGATPAAAVQSPAAVFPNGTNAAQTENLPRREIDL